MGINKRMKRMPLSGLSIQHRLPLLICILLLGVMVAFGWISYLEVKQAALKTGAERLRSLNDQLSTMFSQSMQGYISSTRKAANREPIKNCLRSVNSSCTEAFDSLQKMRQGDTLSVLVDLLDANGSLVVRSGKDSIQSWVDFNSLYSSVKLDSGKVGKLIQVRDSIYYPFVLAVVDDNQTIGYVVRWRLVNMSQQNTERLMKLLGIKATIYFGNADKSLWTNFSKVVSNPIPASMGKITDVVEYNSADGNEVVGSEQAIPNTQWLLLIELPRQTLIEPANLFLKKIILIGGTLVIMGILIAWIVSRNITRPLNKLTVSVSAITSGSYSHSVVADRTDEVGKLARAFNAMVTQVQSAKLELEQKVIEAEQMSAQLRNLSAHLQNIREEERMHIAREMHDELGQLLTGFKMDVSWLNKRLVDNKDPGVRDRLLEMIKIVDESVMFVRRLAAELRPSILDDLGLIAALEWQSKEFTKRYDIEIEFRPIKQDIKTSALVATGLFRMYQESLTNVARHASATKVTAILDIIDGYICLSINDNGKGFDSTTSGQRKTLGLLGMKERALMIGGNLNIQSEPGKGTTVIITVPFTNDSENSSVNGYGKQENKEWK